MAMSFSRPDPASPSQVAEATFSTGRRGFDQGEVRDFLRMVAAELGRLHERERFLERELRGAQASPNLDTARLDDETLMRLVGDETARVLSAARESATEIREKAEQAAARILNEASDEAARRREEAEIEASRRRSDAANDAEAELSMAKQQGREMVNEARAYRERVLTELARRRELAREQIEQLIHGRDRLMQAFERARLVAVDVVSELEPIGEPDEYVNLQPTTGPVPVMVARVDSREPDEVSAPDGVRTSVEPEPVDAAEVDPVEADAAEADAAEADAAEVDPAEVDAAEVDPVDDRLEDEPHGVLETVESESPPALESETETETETETATATATETEAVFETEAVSGTETETEAVFETETETEAELEVEPVRDDVVVDLFARLRRAERAAAPPDHDAGHDDAGHDDAGHDDAGHDDAGHDDAGAAEPAQGVPIVATEHVLGEHDVADPDRFATEASSSGPASRAAIPTEIDDEMLVVEASDVEATVVEASEFEQRDADLTPLIVASARKLKRVLADEQNDVLDQLRRNDAITSLDQILPSADEHGHRYASAISDDMLMAANAGAQIASPTRTARLTKADGRASVDQASAMMREWLVGPLRDRLDRAIRDGASDSTAITKMVRSVYREWKTQHIDEQLDDILRAAHGHGLLAATPTGALVCWTPDPRHGSCPDCDDNALEGPVAAGQAFPTGDTFAPAHPGCRCMLLPAVP
jgi:DivIVA domain-containing protein